MVAHVVRKCDESEPHAPAGISDKRVPRLPAGIFASQFVRPIVGVVLYALAALLGWLIHPMAGIALFAAMIVYHAWTSEGVKPRG